MLHNRLPETKTTTLFRLFLMLFAFDLNAQVVIKIVDVPEQTTKNAKIYIAGSFNNWKANDAQSELKIGKDGKYFIALSDTLSYFEYKFTRGSWETVEGNFSGMRPNRVFDSGKLNKSKLIETTIECWEDQFRYLIKLVKVPKNTPHDATIYIAGNFNNWDSCHKDYKLVKLKNGTYSISIFSTLEKIQYKFTRGNWESVEGRANGRAMHNREILRSKQLNPIIENEVQTWEDLSYQLSIYDFILLFSAFQGLLLILAIFTIHDYNKEANRLLMWLIGITSLGLIFKVLPNYREIFELYPKIILLPETILFLYAPLYYFYVQKLLTIPNKLSKIWYHFIPCVILILLYTPFFMMEKQAFIDRIIDKGLDNIFLGIGGAALLYNAYYWFVCRQIINTYRNQYTKSYSFEQNLHYLNMAVYINGACLGVWIFTCLGVIVGKILQIETIYFIETSTDGIWLVFSAIPYFMGYYAIYQPEVFKLNSQISFLHPVEKLEESDASHGLKTSGNAVTDIDTEFQHMNDDSADTVRLLPLKNKLEAFMQSNKPYINPRLTLVELAENLEIHPNLLSRVINDCFEKNFFDYVNTYRINEFKQLVETTKFENFTLLGIAFEVGFNSKTAFNRSFKKITNLTPSEYFYKVKGKSLKE